jgi:hypothetical protein
MLGAFVIATLDGDGSDCVEVARNIPGIVAVRDSKDPHGNALTVTPDEWARFVTRLKAATA